MSKLKRGILTALCAALCISFGCFAVYRSQQYAQHKDQVFGHSFGSSVNLYSNLYASYAGTIAEYCVTDDGILYVPDYTTRQSGIRQIGELVPFQLSESNFDLCISGAHWCADGVDAAYIRSHTLSSWKCVSEDGELYYLILQENGDVFLALGEEAETITIYEIRCLSNVGDEAVLFGS